MLSYMTGYPQYRCLVHGNWSNHEIFRQCPICKEKTDPIMEADLKNVFDLAKSQAKKAELMIPIRQTAAAAELALEHTIRAATAALDYDIDAWTTADPDKLRDLLGLRP